MKKIQSIIISVLLLAPAIGGIQVKAVNAAVKGELVKTETITINKKAYTFSHRCIGKVKRFNSDNGGTATSYCLGRNYLYLQSGKKTSLLSIETIKTKQRAKELEAVEQVPKTNKVLLRYGHNSCIDWDGGDCGGVGPTVAAYTGIYDSDKKTYRILKNDKCSNYPNNFLMWNQVGTKAICIIDSCGGAGCDEVKLSAWDLSKDKWLVISHAAAVFSVNSDPKSIDGSPLATWKNSHWIDNNNFQTQFTSRAGKRQVIKKSF